MDGQRKERRYLVSDEKEKEILFLVSIGNYLKKLKNECRRLVKEMAILFLKKLKRKLVIPGKDEKRQNEHINISHP